MKKLLFLLFASLLVLGACGQKEETISKGDVEEESVEETEETYSDDGRDALKEKDKKEVNHKEEVGPINVEFKNIYKYTAKVTEENMDDFSMDGSVEPGDELNFLAIDIEAESTQDEPIQYDLDMTEIVTNTGEQLEFADLTRADFNGDFQGATKTKGTIYYQLEDSELDEIEWFDYIMPSLYEDDEYENELFESKKVRFEF